MSVDGDFQRSAENLARQLRKLTKLTWTQHNELVSAFSNAARQMELNALWRYDALFAEEDSDCLFTDAHRAQLSALEMEMDNLIKTAKRREQA